MIQIVSHQYGVEGVGISMQGGRTENQDDMGCLETPLGLLVVVCDGMGGGPGGKTASYISKATVFRVFEQCSELSSPSDVIKKAIDEANNEIEAQIMMMPELKGMGSTIVLLLISEKSAFVAHLGDSRCYQIRDGKVVFRTKDHSLVGELVASGALTEEQARTSSQSNIITRGIGSATNQVAEIEEIPYRRGDRFVLCTDGVWGIMPHTDLQIRLTNRQDISSLVKNLSAEIDQIGFSQGNHHDNHTIAILEIKKDSNINVRMDKKTRMLFYMGAALLTISVVFNVVGFLNYGSNHQMNALKNSNDSLMDVTIQLTEILEDRNEEIGHLVVLNEELEKTIRDGINLSQQERANLLHNIDSMNHKIDSLSNKNKQLQDNNSTRSQNKGAKKNNTSSENSSVQLLEICITNLRSIASMKTLKLNEATARVKKNVDECVRLLNQFNLATNNNYKETVNPILDKLKTDDRFNESKNVQSVGANGGRLYEVQEKTKREINEVVWELRCLKDSI